MRRFAFTLCSLLVAAAASAAPAATALTGPGAGGVVTVSFIDAARYADAGETPRERESNLAALARYLTQLGRDRLPAGESLEVEIVDVDLAGTLVPLAGSGRELRVLRGRADSPRIALRYTLKVPGQADRSGKESLTDLDYLRRLPSANTGESLHYEKRVLADWFSARFAAGRTAAD